MKNYIKKILLLSLLAMLVTSTFTSLAGEFSDMPVGWSKEAMEDAVANGILEGHNNKIMPKEDLTRAEIATILTRVLGLEEKADLSSFKDVKEASWYYDNMAKSVEAGILKGKGKEILDPHGILTREEAFTIMARVFKIAEDTDNLSDFNDGEDVADWAEEYVKAMVEEGYIEGGDNNSILPQDKLTREEFAQIIYNMIDTYLSENTEARELEGNVVLNREIESLEDLTINGDLIIGEGLGKKSLSLKNIRVRGRLLLRAGDEISIEGDSKVGKLLAKDKLDTKILVENEDIVGELEDGLDIELVKPEEKPDTIEIDGKEYELIEEDGKYYIEKDGEKLEVEKDKEGNWGLIEDGEGTPTVPERPGTGGGGGGTIPPIEKPEEKPDENKEKVEETLKDAEKILSIDNIDKIIDNRLELDKVLNQYASILNDIKSLDIGKEEKDTLIKRLDRIQDTARVISFAEDYVNFEVKNADDLKIIEIKKVSVKGQVDRLKDQELKLKLEEIIKVKDEEVEIFREVVRTIEKLKKIEKGKASGEDLKQARQIGESAGKLGFDLGNLEEIIARLSADAIEADNFQGKNLEIPAEAAILEAIENAEEGSRERLGKEAFIKKVEGILKDRLGIEEDRDLPLIEVTRFEINEYKDIEYSYNIRFNDNHMIGGSATIWGEATTEDFDELINTLESQNSFELLTNKDLEKAKEIEEDNKKLKEAIENAEKKIKEDKDKGRLLILDEKEAEEDSYQSVLVKNDKNQQIKTNATNINSALKERFAGIKSGEGKYSSEEYDKETIKGLDEEKIKINFEKIKISSDGRIIFVKDNLFTKEAFKVAKGKGVYKDETYNITILTKDAEKIPGENNLYKAAKIVTKMSENGDLDTFLESIK